MLRSAFVSLFWGIIKERKRRPGGFKLQELAGTIGKNKGEVSRWFRREPNWTLNTVASLANALDVELSIEARERSSGLVFKPSGLVTTQTTYIDTNPLKPVAETDWQEPPPMRMKSNNPNVGIQSSLAA
jgi:hypothetical protein